MFQNWKKKFHLNKFLHSIAKIYLQFTDLQKTMIMFCLFHNILMKRYFLSTFRRIPSIPTKSNYEQVLIREGILSKQWKVTLPIRKVYLTSCELTAGSSNYLFKRISYRMSNALTNRLNGREDFKCFQEFEQNVTLFSAHTLIIED